MPISSAKGFMILVTYVTAARDGACVGGMKNILFPWYSNHAASNAPLLLSLVFHR